MTVRSHRRSASRSTSARDRDAATWGRPVVTVAPASNCDLAGLPARYMNPGELETLVALVRSVAPRTMVEFGCNEGRTAAALLRNVPTLERYIGIDVAPGYRTIQECQRREVPDRAGALASGDRRFELIVRPRGGFDLTPADLPELDVAFIDADHSRAGVLNDWNLARGCVRPGGLIVFHDDNRLPVVQVSETLDELAQAGHDIQHCAGTWLAFVRC